MVWFRQHDESHIVPGEIKLMKWNPKMDLICIATVSGDVSLHRLVQWQKVWVLPYLGSKKKQLNPETNQKIVVVSIEWRPDGKIIAIGYNTNIAKLKKSDEPDDPNSSSIALINVENAEIIHIIEVKYGKVTTLCWAGHKTENEPSSFDFNIKTQTQFLPKLKPFEKTYSSYMGSSWAIKKMTEDNIDDLLKISNLDSLNILVIGTNKGRIMILAFGIYLCGVITLPGYPFISHLSFSEDFGLLQIFTQTCCSSASPPATTAPSVKKFSLISLKLQILKENKAQLKIISQLYAQVISLLFFLNETIQAILEKWEDILLEIDSKLSTYISRNESSDSNSLTADELLELLVFGKLSDTLESFLNKISDKGLKNLTTSIEATYSDIQKLIVKNIIKVSYHLFSHLNTIRGITLWDSEFGQIGLDINMINMSIKSIGSFLIKSVELQQVIGNSVGNLISFLNWLLTSLVRISGEQTQSDNTKISQQNIQFVSEFIQENFEFEKTHKNVSSQESNLTSNNFMLGRVGQYFKDENLTTTEPLSEKNPWIYVINQHPELTKIDNEELLLFNHNSNKSLSQEHKILEKSIKSAFEGPTNVLNNFSKRENSELKYIINLPMEDHPVISHLTNLNEKALNIALLNTSTPADEFYMLKFPLNDDSKIFVSSAKFYLSNSSSKNYNSNEQLKILDLQFYNEILLTFLLANTEKNIHYLVQFPFEIMKNNFKTISGQVTSYNLSELCTSTSINMNEKYNNLSINYRTLDNMKASFIAVSGSRKVACVAFASKKRIRLFEMDSIEEEEEDEEEEEEDNQEQEKQRRETSIETGTGIEEEEQESTLMNETIENMNIESDNKENTDLSFN